MKKNATWNEVETKVNNRKSTKSAAKANFGLLTHSPKFPRIPFSQGGVFKSFGVTNINNIPYKQSISKTTPTQNISKGGRKNGK